MKNFYLLTAGILVLMLLNPALNLMATSLLGIAIYVALGIAIIRIFPTQIAITSATLFLVIVYAAMTSPGMGYAGGLVILALPILAILFGISFLLAQRTSNPFTLLDVNIVGSHFSFTRGVVNASDDWDLMLNLPRGLASNNEELNIDFQQGGIIDLGDIPLTDIKEAPESGYISALTLDNMIVDHSYCVKRSNGQQYGKIRIIKYNPKTQYIKFMWCSASMNTRTFT